MSPAQAIQPCRLQAVSGRMRLRGHRRDADGAESAEHSVCRAVGVTVRSQPVPPLFALSRYRLCARARAAVVARRSSRCSSAAARGQASVASAQTPFVPYFGKNHIHYDNFEWHIYTTDHFEIYYYPEIEQHLERVAGYAESAYQQISADLKHDLPFKVPLILFKTHSEFEQQNVDPGRGAGRRRRLRRAVPRPHGAADRRAARPALPASSPTS